MSHIDGAPNEARGARVAMQTAYHFLKADMTAESGQEEPWVIGEKRSIKGEIALCERGYHSAPTPWEALTYAPGPMLCEVQVARPVAKDRDKQVSRTRLLIAAVDVTSILHEFACGCAEDVLPLFEQSHPHDSRPRKAIETKRRWLRGEATDQELAAARAAARGAARAAAGDAAWGAARAAAGDAAWALPGPLPGTLPGPLPGTLPGPLPGTLPGPRR